MIEEESLGYLPCR